MATAFFTPTFNSSKQRPPPLYCAVLSAPSSSTTDLLLQVKDLSAVIAQSKQPILEGVNLTIRHGELLGAEFAILDEIDSGLDVDALQDVAKAVNGILTSENSVLMITHYLRLLEFIKPTYIHVMENGRIVKIGDITIAEVLEKEGYKAIS